MQANEDAAHKPQMTEERQRYFSGDRERAPFAAEHLGRARITDNDPVRHLHTAVAGTRIANGLGLSPDSFEIHVERQDAGASGAYDRERNVVWLAPDAFDPTAAEGRYLLGHEIAHVAQARLTDAATAPRGAAEAEARAVGRAAASGSTLAPPRAPLGAGGVAHDTGKRTPMTEEEALKLPPLVSVNVIQQGLAFFPIKAKPQVLAEGIEKSKQFIAMMLLALAGKSYDWHLVDQCIAHLTAHYKGDKALFVLQVVGPAGPDEPVPPFGIEADQAQVILQFLKNKNIKPTLSDAQMATLSTVEDALHAWQRNRELWNANDVRKWPLPGWYHDGIYTLMSTGWGKQIRKYGAARRAFEQDASKEKERDEAFKELGDEVVRYTPVLEAIRADLYLVDHEVYRGLWRMPAKDPSAPANQDLPVAPTRMPHIAWAAKFLQECYSEAALAELAKTSHEARVKLLTHFGNRMKWVHRENVRGDVKFRDEPSRANVPPLKAQMSCYPAITPPHFDRMVGSNTMFFMNLRYEDAWQHFMSFGYKWELIHIPEDDWARHKETAENLKTGGTRVKPSSAMYARLERDETYNEEDVRTVIDALGSRLGPALVAATDFDRMNLALSKVGTVIKSTFEAIAKPLHAFPVPFPSTGLFVVRCIAIPEKPKDPLKTEAVRAASVAWMPVWVRSADDMISRRVKEANTDEKESEETLKKWEKELEEGRKNKTLQPVDEKNLVERIALLRKSLYGDVATLLGLQLDAAKEEQKKIGTREDDPGGWDAQQKRIDEINEILAHRAQRFAGKGEPKLEQRFKIRVIFVGDESNALQLAMEGIQVKASDDKKHKYFVNDATTKDSFGKEGEEADTRSEAIKSAILAILRGSKGYGRGFAHIKIPAGAGEPASELTERITPSATQVLLKTTENAALVASVALMALAPFWGGAMTVMVPVGIVGGIPSGYRLAERADQGTFRLNDPEVVGDIVNVVAAAMGVGGLGAQSGNMVVRAVSKGMVVMSTAMDWAQVLLIPWAVVAGYDSLDPEMPDELRYAALMEMIGGHLLTLGFMAGSRLIARAAELRASSGTQKPVLAHHGHLDAHLTSKLGNKKVRVFKQETPGRDVTVKYETDGWGLVKEIYVVAQRDASIHDIDAHIGRIKSLQSFEGLIGLLRSMRQRLDVIFGGPKRPPPGSKGYDARGEVTKIGERIATLHDEVAKGGMTKEEADNFHDYLKKQAAYYQQFVDSMEAGSNQIGQRSPQDQAAINAGYPKNIPAGHYYIETPNGYDLVPRADFVGDFHRLRWDGNQWIIEPEPKTALADVPKKGAKGAPPPPVPKGPDVPVNVTALKDAVATRFGVKAEDVRVNSNADRTAIRPPSETGGGYEILMGKDAKAEDVHAAIDQHAALAKRRPPDLKNPFIPGTNPPVRWTGSMEAKYRGRPVPDDLSHWALRDGKLEHHTEATGQKMKWDEKAAKLVLDTGPRPETFAGGTTREQAWTALGGDDPEAPFGRWVKYLVDKGIVSSKDDIFKTMQAPSELTHDTVRHNMKKGFKKALIDHHTRAEPLQKRYPELFQGISPSDGAVWEQALAKARHKAVLEARDALHLKDATNTSEAWYVELFTHNAETQVKLDKAVMAAQDNPIHLDETRVPDALDKETVKSGKKEIVENVFKEIKLHEGPVGSHDIKQLTDLKKTLGKEVTRTDGTKVKIDRIVEVFIHPEGGKVNAEMIAAEVKDNVKVQFEVFNTQGERWRVTTADLWVTKNNSKGNGTETTLAAAIRTFCMT